MVVVVPIPAMAPGFRVQFPEGNPFNSTLPVATRQVGWVMAPTAGVAGVAGWAWITTSAEAGEIHPAALVTV